MELFISKSDKLDSSFDAAILHLCNLSSIQTTEEKVENTFSFIANGTEYFIPFGENVNTEEEKEKLISEINYAKGFLNSIDKKLSNERFVNNAPEQVVAMERKKQEDAMNKIKLLEEKLNSLN